MNDQANLAFRQEILERLGAPEPELPGVSFVGTSGPDQWALMELFDDMCMSDVRDRALFERAISTLEGIRERDYQVFYLGRSELLCMYPVIHEVPAGPEVEVTVPTPPPPARNSKARSYSLLSRW